MRRIFFLFLLFVPAIHSFSQTWLASSAAYDNTALGYIHSGVGTYYRATGGGTATVNSGLTACNGSTSNIQMGSSLFIFKADVAITAIQIHGNSGTGSTRTLSSVATSSTLAGTYTAVGTASASGNLSGSQSTNVCSPAPMTITFGTTIAANTFFRVTLSGNAYVASIVLTPAAVGPTITAGSLTTFGNQVTNATSPEKTYNVSGSNLTNNITITPPSGYEISTGTGGSFVATNPITLAHTGGTVASTPIYVRFKPTVVQSYNGNITHTSTGADPKDVGVTGSGVAPSPPTALAISHRSDNIQRLSWTAPSGNYDQVLIFARAVGDVSHTPSGAGSAYNNANADIGSAGVYSTDNFLVYAGTGTNVEVTGLSNNTAYYYQVFAYSGSVYSTAASLNGITAVQPTTAFIAPIASQQSALTWTNPAFNGTQTNYWDEVIVLAKAGSAVDQAPTGDASTYNANATFGSGTDIGSGNFVVYKGNGTGVTVTGLTNGTTYHYATYVRHGLVWSVAQTASATPNLASNATDAFRSKATGNWNAVTPGDVWESFTNGGWMAATVTPGTDAASITISTMHEVTIPNGASITADDVMVETGGQITINAGGVLIIANGGAATDLVVNGYLKNSGTLTLNGAASVGGSTAIYEHNLNTVNNVPGFTWSSGSTLLLSGTFSTASGSSAGSLTSLSYQNIEVNCNLQNTDAYFVLGAQTISGTLKISATGNGAVLSTTGNAFVCNTFEMSGGNFYVNRQAGANRALTVTGNANISGGVFYAKINANSTQNGSLGQFTVGGNLTIGAAATVSNGALAGQTASTTPPQIIFNGTTNQIVSVNNSLSGTIEIIVNKSSGILYLNTDLTSTGAFTITSGSVEVAAGKRLTLSNGGDFNGNAVILKSDATGTSSIGQITGVLSDATNVTVERYIPSSRSWRFLTAPLTGASNNSVFYNWQNNGDNTGDNVNKGVEIWGPGGGNGLASGAAASLRKYTTTWSNITNTQSEPLFTATKNNAFAIFVTGPYGSGNIASNSAVTTLKATGSLITGQFDLPVTTTASHTLVGNPYASAINVHSLVTSGTNSPNLEPTVWFWDPSLGSNGRGGYVTYTVGSRLFSSSNNYPGTAQDAIAQSGQAFFVKATNLFSLRFIESMKTTGSSNAVFRTSNVTEALRTSLYKIVNNNPVLADGVLSLYVTGANASVDNIDASKLANSGENLAIVRNSRNLSIEYRPTISANDTIFLNMWNTGAGTYRFAFEAMNLSGSGLAAFLEDAYLNTSTPVSLDGNIITTDFTVTADAATTGNRFRIVFRTANPLPVAVSSIKAYEKGASIAVDWNNSSESNVDRYEVERSADGRSFTKAATVAAKSNNGGAVNYQWIDNTPFSGNNYYRIKVYGAGNDNKYSSIVKVSSQKGAPSVSLYPNPVKGEAVQLQLNNMAKGQYTIVLYNSVGQQVMQRTVQHNGGSASESISLGNSMAAGTYVLRLIGGDINLQQRIIVERP